MKSLTLSLFLAVLGFTFSSAQAADSSFYKIQSVESHLVSMTDTPVTDAQVQGASAEWHANDFMPVLPGLGEVINMGKELWAIVLANKPVLNYK